MGNTSISLLRNFENDSPFMTAFQNQFAKASLFADVAKYWKLFYTDKEIEAGFEEAHKKIIPKTGRSKNIAADIVSRSPFEKHLIELQAEFYTLVSEGKAPKSCYTHNIQETNIYKQFKAVEDTFNRFKELKNFDPLPNSLLKQAEEFGQGIISEIQRIDYEPIREKIIEAIVNDVENIYTYLPKIVDSITNSNSGNFNEKEFSDNYANAKMYLNNYLQKHLRSLEVGQVTDQQTETIRKPQKFIANEYALAYIFDLYAKRKQIPINQTDGGYNKRELIKSGFDLYKFDNTKDTFYRAVKHVATFDLNKQQDLVNISNRWIKAVKTLSKDWVKTEQYLKEKGLIGE